MQRNHNFFPDFGNKQKKLLGRQVSKGWSCYGKQAIVFQVFITESPKVCFVLFCNVCLFICFLILAHISGISHVLRLAKVKHIGHLQIFLILFICLLAYFCFLLLLLLLLSSLLIVPNFKFVCTSDQVIKLKMMTKISILNATFHLLHNVV